MSYKPQMNSFEKLTTGQLLRTRRVELGISLEQASQDTKITIGQLTALETNDYHSFDSYVFASGFIKIYAKYLNMQPEPLLALFRRDSAMANETTGNINKSKKSFRFNLRELQEKAKELLTPNNIFKIGISFFILITLIYLYINFYKYQAKPTIEIFNPANNSTVTTQEISIDGITSANTDIKINNQSVSVDENLAFTYKTILHHGANEIKIDAFNRINRKITTSKTIVVTLDTASEEKQEVEEKQKSTHTLTLSISNEPVWIQLNIDSKQAVAGVLSDGYNKDFSVTSDFQIITGKPKSTVVKFDGQKITLPVDSTTGTVNTVCTVNNNSYQCR
jgi:cytoskeletal protein RodZ